MEGFFFFFKHLPTPLKIPIRLHTFFHVFGLLEAPHPQEIPIPSVGEYGYFLERHIVLAKQMKKQTIPSGQRQYTPVWFKMPNKAYGSTLHMYMYQDNFISYHEKMNMCCCSPTSLDSGKDCHQQIIHFEKPTAWQKW